MDEAEHLVETLFDDMCDQLPSHVPRLAWTWSGQLDRLLRIHQLGERHAVVLFRPLCLGKRDREPPHEIVRDRGPSERKDEVAVMQVGSWSSLRGTVRGHSVIMAGRVSELDLATVLDSSLR